MHSGSIWPLALCLVVAAPSAAFAQAQAQPGFPNPLQQMFQGTPEDQAACRGDSGKFCKDAEPDQLRVLACLRSNRTAISTACANVLRKYGQYGP
ncbi:MAG: hypothetical protein HXY30_09075 [Pseudorhodoplanes sp.]|nr:hypothetical protein [Pseudorhodoplanes sp.]